MKRRQAQARQNIAAAFKVSRARRDRWLRGRADPVRRRLRSAMHAASPFITSDRPAPVTPIMPSL